MHFSSTDFLPSIIAGYDDDVDCYDDDDDDDDDKKLLRTHWNVFIMLLNL